MFSIQSPNRDTYRTDNIVSLVQHLLDMEPPRALQLHGLKA